MRKQLWQTRCTLGCSRLLDSDEMWALTGNTPHTPSLHPPSTHPQLHSNTGWEGTHIDWIHLAPFMHIDTMALANRSLTQSTPQSVWSVWATDSLTLYFRMTCLHGMKWLAHNSGRRLSPNVVFLLLIVFHGNAALKEYVAVIELSPDYFVF